MLAACSYAQGLRRWWFDKSRVAPVIWTYAARPKMCRPLWLTAFEAAVVTNYSDYPGYRHHFSTIQAASW